MFLSSDITGYTILKETYVIRILSPAEVALVVAKVVTFSIIFQNVELA